MAELTGAIQDFLPQGEAGLRWARVLAESIVRSHKLKADRWGLSPVGGLLRLNLGMIEVLTISPTAVRVLVDTRVLRDRSELLDAKLLYQNTASPKTGVLKSVAGSAVCYAWHIDHGDLLYNAPLLDVEQAHVALLTGAALTTRNPKTKTGHSIRAVKALSKLVGRDLPQPTYAVA